MGEASLQNVLTWKCILRCFELASGLKINFMKSCCIGIHVSSEDHRLYAFILNCRVANIPFVYLGIPIGGNPRRALMWQPILEKMRRKLSSWKQKMLSVGGRICLIKSILMTLPLFFLSFFRVPKGVVREAKRIMRTFLWGGVEEDHKISWVKWEHVCQPKLEGGLGIKDWEAFNKALWVKWRCKLLGEGKDLCSKVIWACYDIRISGGELNATKRDSIWWRDLFNLCFESDAGLCWFDEGIRKKLGNGHLTLFWKDVWCGSS